MGEIVIDALAGTDLVDSIYIVGEKSHLEKQDFRNKVSQIIQEKGDFYVNAMEAFKHAANSDDPEKQVLYLACDIPFVNSMAIGDFIRNAPPADFVFPYCVKEDFEALFPQYWWPYQVYKEGHLKFGNVGLVKPNKIKNKQLFDIFHNMRKVAVSDRRFEEYANVPRILGQALRLGGIEGLEMAIREFHLKYVAPRLGSEDAAADRLSIDRIAHLFSRVLMCDGRAVKTCYPELCFDIDNETTDLKYSVDNYQAIKERINLRRARA